jgi:hypothetical protein
VAFWKDADYWKASISAPLVRYLHLKRDRYFWRVLHGLVEEHLGLHTKGQLAVETTVSARLAAPVDVSTGEG